MHSITSLSRKAWQLVITLCTTFVAVFIPLNLVFKFELNSSFIAVYWFITAIFTIDIFIYLFPEKSLNSEQNYETVNRKDYLKGWFAVDFIAAIPFMFIFNLPALGILRLLKFTRIAQYMHLWRQRSVKFGDYLILGFFIYWLMIVTHWLTCGWIALRNYPFGSDSLTNYVKSLYWVIETITTVGYGDVVPQNNIQHIYAMMIMLGGVGVYGFVIGNIANILSKRNPAKTQFYNNLEQLKVFVNYRNIPLSLQKKVRDYYTYIWKKKLGFDESVFLSGLPQGLQNEVSVHLKRQILEKIPLFKGVSDDFLQEVSLYMRPVIVIPDECIFKEGDAGNEMYFVIRGKLEVKHAGKALAVLTDGDFFGEIALFNNEKRRTATVTSLTYSDLYRLDRELFDKVLKRYPKIAEHIKRIAKERLEYNLSEDKENVN